MNQITSLRGVPDTFQELRQQIEDARKIYVQVLWNDGLGGGAFYGDADYIEIEVTKTTALSLYKGFKGDYLADSHGAHYDVDKGFLYLN